MLLQTQEMSREAGWRGDVGRQELLCALRGHRHPKRSFFAFLGSKEANSTGRSPNIVILSAFSWACIFTKSISAPPTSFSIVLVYVNCAW